MSVTLDELKRRIRGTLSEGSGDFFTNTNLADWINEAQAVIYSDAPFTNQATWALSNEQAMPYGTVFLVPEDCGVPTGVLVRRSGGTVEPLDFIEPDRMTSLRGGASPTSGNPVWYTVWLTEEGPAVEMYPPLSAATDIYVEGFKVPTLLVNDTDRTDLPRELIPPVVFYALWCAKGKDEEDRQAREYERKFAQSLDNLAERRLEIQAGQHNLVRAGRSLRWPRYQYYGGWR